MSVAPPLLFDAATVSWWWLPILVALFSAGAVLLWLWPKVTNLRKQNLDLQEKIQDRAKLVVQQKEVIQHKITSLEKAYNDFRVMSQIGQELTTNLDLEVVFDKLYTQVNMLMDAAVFGVHLYDPEREVIIYKYVLENGDRAPSIDIPMGQPTISAYCIRNREEVVIKDLAKEYKRYLPAATPISGKLPNSVLYMPLILQSEMLGAITVQSFSKAAYSKEHVNVLRVLASYTAIAIGNANAYHSLEYAKANIQRQHNELASAYSEISEKNASLTAAKELIERHNASIMDSLEYARRIQEAIMPSQEEVAKALPQNFIYYRPKDIVSGDFFWYAKRNNQILLAAVDCTGHGVPGAFMSVLGSTLLNQIVLQEGHTDPDDILVRLDKRVMQMLRQMDPNADATDGMDVSLVTLNKDTFELTFAGANRPLFYVSKRELLEIKGNKYPVGGKLNIHDPYKKHTITLEKGDSFYVFTDGYADQFGGPHRRKFLNKRFMQLLKDVSRLSIEKQREILDEAFENWRGSEKQLDDVLVIGVRV